MKTQYLIAVLCTGFVAVALSCKHQPETVKVNEPPTVTTAVCSADTVYFQQQVLPIFVSNCALSGCHDAAAHKEGVNLTTYASILTTGDVRPFNPGGSKSWKLINAGNSDRMPPLPQAALSQAQKDVIYKWIVQGARNNSCASAACDSATAVTFSGKIKSILGFKCTGCHSGPVPQGGIDLSVYAGLKAKVADGRLWGSINHLTGYSPMPKSNPQQKLSDCEIRQFKKWMDAGAPNN